MHFVNVEIQGRRERPKTALLIRQRRVGLLTLIRLKGVLVLTLIGLKGGLVLTLIGLQGGLVLTLIRLKGVQLGNGNTPRDQVGPVGEVPKILHGWRPQ
jgi:hypothetical protein